MFNGTDSQLVNQTDNMNSKHRGTSCVASSGTIPFYERVRPSGINARQMKFRKTVQQSDKLMEIGLFSAKLPN